MQIAPSSIRMNRLRLLCLVFCFSCTQKHDTSSANASLPDKDQLAANYFGEDSAWYKNNIPFFECSDKAIEQVYYYRWKMYKAHIRSTGDNAYVITEFIQHVPWDREPFCTINAASMHHIYEGRWLKDDRYINGYIDNLYQLGGNNRRYSESVADAAWARYLVNGDKAFLEKQLDSMKSIYNQWSDHWEAAKNLYYIPAMPDATEYTIASIDGSGGKAGFDGGDAFRPTINSYMYANALAISRIAALKGDTATSHAFLLKAQQLKKNVEDSLWNEQLQHFCDRFKQDNEYVHYWDFIRGRELAGMIPWYFDLPSDKPSFNGAWKHVIDTSNLLGQYGLRTNEPSYEYYFKQFAYYEGKRSSQWNGPSWPYQTSMVLTGMANLLNDYHQDIITNTNYLDLLRRYTRQHFLPGGKINLVENYDPNLGGPIVYCYWSNHYNHSSYNNLVISGLCGIRPSEGDTLVINPLTDESISYFWLGDVSYHGHKLSLAFDKDGSRYKMGKGLTVWVDDKKAELMQRDGKYKVFTGVPVSKPVTKEPVNHALNIAGEGYPAPSASVNNTIDQLKQAVDGRTWYFPEVNNYWSSTGSVTGNDWFAVDFGKPVTVSSVCISPVTDNTFFHVPDSLAVEYYTGKDWLPAKITGQYPLHTTGNTTNRLNFEAFTASRVRLLFFHHDGQVAMSEIAWY